jgi:hypothetical protein
MGRQLTETEDQLNIDSIGNGNTTTSITRPAFKFGKSKVGDVNLPQERTVDDGVGFVGFEPDLQRERIQTQSEIKVSGKYPEVNYVTFNLPDINLVESISGNVYSGVIKRVFPVENLEPTDTSTSDTSGTSGTSTTQGPTYPPFGEPGNFVGEIRQAPQLNNAFFIWTFNYNVGRWAPYVPDISSGTSGGGAVGGSGNQNNDNGPGGMGNQGGNLINFDQSGGSGPAGRNNNLGGSAVTGSNTGGGPPGGGPGAGGGNTFRGGL